MKERLKGRRARIDLHTPAEKAIYDAVDAVEKTGCHPLLTDAVCLLSQAKDKVGEFVDQSKEIVAKRENGNIVITIPEDTLVFAVENNPDESLKVTDKERFLNHITTRLVTDVGFNNDSGLSSFHRLLDEASNEAVEMDAGIEVKEWI